MIESITVNYECRDFFGKTVMRSDECWRPLRGDVERSLGGVRNGAYVHFHYGDGSHDCLYADAAAREAGRWWEIHWDRWNSKDDPRLVSPREARAAVRAHLEEL